MRRTPTTIAALAVLWLLGIGLVPGNAAGNALPRPAGLEPDIGFWRIVFAEVTSGEVVIHDNRHLGVVYEKFAIPPGSSDSQRRRLMAAKVQKYERLLTSLAAGNRSGTEARRVLALWPGNISNDGLREASRRVRAQQGLADRFRQGYVRAGRWQDHIRESLRNSGVPDSLAALPHVESSFNPEARSHVGASGLWQFTAGTGRRFMRIDEAVDERRDPYRSSEAAARLLRSNYAALGTWPLAITAYNHGTGGMRRAVRSVGSTDIERIVRRYDGPAFGFASRNFYVSFLAAEEVERNADRYFGPLTPDPAERHAVVVLPGYMPADTLARTFGVSRDTLQAYNPALLPAVWKGRKLVPRGFPLRLPGDLEAEAPRRLAAIPASERRAAQTPGPASATHRVRSGESLSVIARRHGTSVATLARLNNLSGRHMIRAGQVLKLPGGDGPALAAAGSASGSTYTVRAGDSLGVIARRTGVSERNLLAWNGIRDRNRIVAGQRLRLHAPGSAPATAGDGPGTYVVRRGDSLASIAKRTGISQQQLVAINALGNPNRIYPGQTLRLGQGPEGG